MAIFRQSFAIDSPLAVREAWKNLLAATKTDQPTCGNCGHLFTAKGAGVCSSCGQPMSPQDPPKPWLRAFSSRKEFEFEGSISPQEFRMSRIISYRNPCIPIISGRFEPSGAGTRIIIKMKMHALGYVLLVPGCAVSFLAPAVILAGSDGPLPAWFAMLPFAAPCVIAGVCWLFFAMEASMARELLSRIWETAPR